LSWIDSSNAITSKNSSLSKAWEDHLKTNLKVGDKVKGFASAAQGDKFKGKVTSLGKDGGVFIKPKMGKSIHDLANVNRVKTSDITSHKQKTEDGGSVKFKKKNFEKAGGMEEKMDLIKKK